MRETGEVAGEGWEPSDWGVNLSPGEKRGGKRSGRNILDFQVVKERLREAFAESLSQSLVSVDSYLSPQQEYLRVPDVLRPFTKGSPWEMQPCAHSGMDFRTWHLRPLIKLCSLQFSITWANFVPPGDIWPHLGTFLIVTSWRRELLTSSGWRPGILRCTARPLQQRMIWSKLSVVLGLRNAA